MRRAQLEHLFKAASAITDCYEIVVVGSQSILGAFPDASKEFTLSMEADFYPLENPALSELIEGSLGEGSQFHKTFDYYAHDVGPETAKLPVGWNLRLVKIQNQGTDLRIGYCLDPTDLAESKLVAGRDKDREFVGHMIDQKFHNVSSSKRAD